MSSSSQFMDKQIMGSQSIDFFALLNPQDVQSGHGKKEYIIPTYDSEGKREYIAPSYDFQPLRPIGTSTLDGASVGGWNSADSKSISSAIPNYGSVEPHDLAIDPEKDKDVHDTAIISEIERTMKKYTENLLHTLEGVSARISQMETRTRQLESSVDDLKVSVGNNHGSTDGKLRQMENILREVQTGIQVMCDKQEIAKAQLQLSKLQVSKPADQAVETPNTTQTDSVPQHSIQPPAVTFQQPASFPTLTPHAPLQTLSQNPPQAVQFPSQLPTSQPPSIPVLPQDSYYAPPVQWAEATHLQYQMPTQQVQQTSPQPYQGPPPHAQFSETPQLTQQQQALAPISINPPPQQLQPQMNLPEENPYMPSVPQTYPPSIRPHVGPPQSQSGSPSSPQFFGPNSHMYEPSGSRSGAGHFNFPSACGPATSGPSLSDSYAFSGSLHYGGSSLKQPPHSSPSAPSGGRSGYSRIPTAQLLPQVLPTASSVGSNSSGGTGNRVPVDDVVEKVSTMGFSRDQVRATVRKLTENGQSVDLNVVLDKLMNDGEAQPQKGWFGR